MKQTFLSYFFKQRIPFWTFVLINLLYFALIFNLTRHFVEGTLWVILLFSGIALAANYLLLSSVHKGWKNQ